MSLYKTAKSLIKMQLKSNVECKGNTLKVCFKLMAAFQELEVNSRNRMQAERQKHHLSAADQQFLLNS